MISDDEPAQRPEVLEIADGVESGNSNVESDGQDHMYGSSIPANMNYRLMLNPNTDHEPDNYEDLQLDFSPLIFSSLERYLPPDLIHQERDVKVDFMAKVLHRYYPEKEKVVLQKQKEYRRMIFSNYKRLHEELYNINPETFFVPSFLRAINENTEKGFREIMYELHPGVFTFEIFQPKFCEMMIEEVENIERWLLETKFRIVKPNMLNKYGVALNDFGFQSMLDKLVEEFIRPISKIFFSNVGGATLDGQHGYIVEYGIDKGVDMCMHVDDSEVTLNVCLGTEFSGGSLYFRGVRCDNHMYTDAKIMDEVFDYQHVSGHALLHYGTVRHGARATTSGSRINLVLWFRSSMFRELLKYQEDFSSWCGECLRIKKEKHRQTSSAIKSVRGDFGSHTYLS